jgi:SpoVK/Ycf46/Vps4 family AAA+-type ATPase
MQDRQGDVFVVATANDIKRLPPEFLRKGRFDEIFFVDLPDEETRREVFRIHLSGRGQDPAAYDLDALGTSTDGFSGSEIEQVVVSALYTAFSNETEVATDGLLAEVRGTMPLSVTMAEHMDALRAWADGRTVRAN